ncbi:MAG: hypothetical protein LBT76_02070 [Tannerella sp.]|jgi:hypothetical protein|nr:hypothetical protein [Tannerella sp.]
MTQHDYIPRRHEALLNWLEKFMPYLKNNLERFGVASGEEASLEAAVEAYRTAFARVNRANAGSSDRCGRREKADEATAAVRSFVNRYLRYNGAVTNEDRVGLGLRVRDTTLTPASVPESYPEALIFLAGFRQLKVVFREYGRSSRGKPLHVTGCEIRHAILDAPPASIDELVHSTFCTHSPCLFEFDESQRGKAVYFCLRWENTRGRKGPWSSIVMAFIP